MNASAEAILLISVLAAVALTAAVIGGRRREERLFENRIRKIWGGSEPRSYSDAMRKELKTYAGDVKDEGSTPIDDITWQDSDLDTVFGRTNQTLSSPGEDVLYAWLRHPLYQKDRLNRRAALIDRLGEDEQTRLKIQRICCRVGRSDRYSYYQRAKAATKAPLLHTGGYIALAVLTLAVIALLFLHPLAAIALMVPDFILNIAVQLRARGSRKQDLLGMKALLRILDGAEDLLKLDLPELEDQKAEVREVLASFAPFRRGSFLLEGKGTIDTGLGAVLLEYLNLFFHLDLIRYGRMVSLMRGREKEIFLLTTYVGQADAALAAASYRKVLPIWCRPELREDMTGYVFFKDLIHPLLESPVGNSLEAGRGNLLTGANASGKSTFLKSIMIGAILAQSMATAPAKMWKASFFRILSSMALKDNLAQGESYFAVEIRSLKRIMDAVEEDGLPVLAAIDEVLRGTNTIERIAASAAVLRKIEEGRSVIFAATHDIELTRILKDCYWNLHFSGQVKDGDVRFDYTLKGGPARARNAIALMRAAGYDRDVADSAARMAQHFEETGEWDPIVFKFQM